MAESLVLDSPAALVQLGVGQLRHVKGVRHLGGVGEGVVEGLAVRARQVQDPPADLVTPVLGSILEPPGWADGGAAGDHIQ